jgi:hypothetical protein
MARVSASSRWATRWASSGEGLGELGLQAHLALEVGEHRLDDQADARLGALAGRPLAEAVVGGGDQVHADEIQRAVVFGSPEAAVGEQQAARVGAGQLPGRLAFLAGLGPARS